MKLKIHFDTLEEYQKWVSDKIQEQGKEVFIKSEEYRVAYPRYRKLWNEKHNYIPQKRVIKNKIGFIARAYDKNSNVSDDLHDYIEEKFTSFTQGKIRAKELAKTIFKKYKKIDYIIFDFLPLDEYGEITYGKNNPFEIIEYSRDNTRFDNGGEVFLAPNGKPSKLTPEQYLLVRTPAFKAWFGDWESSPETASKVVDKNGEPLVVYHFTDAEFNIFELKGLSNGFFFTENKKDDEFSKVSVLELINKGEYPNWIKKFMEQGLSIEQIIQGVNESSYEKVKSYFLNIKKMYPLSWVGEVSDKQWSTPYFENLYIDKARERNFNGIEFIREKDKKRIIVVLEPNQIKLADGTNTTFDSNNPDIRFAGGGQIEKYKDYEIEIKEIGNTQVQATITQNGNHIGMISLDNFPNEPYVNHSGIDDKHRGKGLGSYVYQLLDDYSFKKTGKHITHGDIVASISAIRLWRKRLKDPNYLPYYFYDYWEDEVNSSDAEEFLKELNSGNKYELGGELTLTSEQVKNKLGRELHWWNDDIVYLSGIEYKKVYLRPEYKRVF